MKELFLQISNRQDLTQEQVQEVFDQILQNQLSESQIAAFLMGLKTKGNSGRNYGDCTRLKGPCDGFTRDLFRCHV